VARAAILGRVASAYVPQTIAGISRSAEPAGRAAGLVAARAQRASAAASQIPTLYRALMTLAYHHVMKIRDNMSAVIEGLQKDHGLLAAYLEATDKIDWRALHKSVLIGEAPKPVNVEAHQASTAPQLPEVVRSTSPFVFRRTNLLRVP
jgi:hypothetical protein